MALLDFLPVTLILILGTITDIRHARVKNKHLLSVFALWAVLMVYKFINAGDCVLTSLWIINAILAFVTSLVFYLIDVWAPGDCKMYTLIAMIYPMYAYTAREGNVFPSLNIVFYAFALGYIAIIVSVLYRFFFRKSRFVRWSAPLELSKERVFSMLSTIGFISALSMLSEACFPVFYDANRVFCTLTLIGLLCLLQRKANRIKIIVGQVGLLFTIAYDILLNVWYSAFFNLALSIVVSILLEAANRASQANTYKTITGDEVRAGMILSLSSIMAMRNCVDPNLPRSTTENRRSRMTEAQAEAVRQWCKNARSVVVIVEMIPFAPFIAISMFAQMILYFIRY